MKKTLRYVALAAAFILAACQVGEREIGIKGRSAFSVRLSVEQIGGNVEKSPSTRATVTALNEEKNMENLTLLFFNHSNSRSGEFVMAYDVENPVAGALVDLEVGYGEGVGLSHSENYSILAYANLDDYVNIGAFVAGLAGKTEAQAIEQLTLTATGAFDIERLPMSGRVAKMAGQELVDLRLTRAVVRLDVKNAVSAHYDLTSVSIYGAPRKTCLWRNDEASTTAADYFARFYGTGDAGSSATIDDNEVAGGLYAFENFEGNPVLNPAVTTSLVVGLTAKAGATVGVPGQTCYYRFDVCPEESAQSILRNNVYVASIRGVLETGASNEAAAAADPGGLDVVINNWDLDGEGMILTDGQSTMAVPSKFVRFGPDPGSQTLDIFTVGPGTLSITRSDLPNGFSASLTGNRLTVATTNTLADGADEISGTFELGYGGLRGTVTVIQSPDIEHFLTVTPSTLDVYAPTGPADGELVQVSASGPWTAELYNPSQDAGNPGFEFENGDFTWDSATDGTSAFYFRTTGSNAGNDVRFGFAVFTLTGHPEYRQVVVLSQEAVSSLRILPYFDQTPGNEDVMSFDMAGVPNPDNGVATEGSYYKVAVSSGTNSTGVSNGWTAALVGDDNDRFNLNIVDGDVYISAKGSANSSIPGLNLGVALNTTLRIGLDGVDAGEAVRGIHYFEIPVHQDPFAFTTTRVSTLDRVPVGGSRIYAKGDLYGVTTGGKVKYVAGDLYGNPLLAAAGTTYDKGAYVNYVEFTVDIPGSLEWDATITDQSHDETAAGGTTWKVHKGYIIDDGNNQVTSLTNRASTQKLRIGFDKIYYPMVHWADSPNIPSVEVTVSIAGMPSLSTVVTVEQQPLVAKLLKQNLFTISATDPNQALGYGNPTSTLSESITNAFRGANFYGPSNTVVRIGDNANIAFADDMERTWWTIGLEQTWSNSDDVQNNRNYLHIGGTDINRSEESMEAFERWRTNPNTDGFVQYIDDEVDGIWEPHDDGYEVTTKVLGWTGGYNAPDSDARLNPSAAVRATRVMKYLTDGPFGQFTATTTNFYFDGVNNYVRNAGPHTVPVLVEVNNPTMYTMLAVDPVERVVYNGDVQMFYVDMGVPAYEQKHVLLRNLTAMMINSAMYGSHFYDLLREDCPIPLYKIVSSTGTDVVTKLAE